jgi:hypothetical protein
VTARRTRPNGEGSIFPYRNGFAAYAWVARPDGTRTRKYVYGRRVRVSTSRGSSCRHRLTPDPWRLAQAQWAPS